MAGKLVGKVRVDLYDSADNLMTTVYGDCVSVTFSDDRVNLSLLRNIPVAVQEPDLEVVRLPNGVIFEIGKYKAPYRENPEVLRELYERHRLTTTEVANIVGCSATTVCDRLKKFGIKARGGGRRPRSRKE